MSTDDTEHDIFDFLFNDSDLGREAAQMFREAHEDGEFTIECSKNAETKHGSGFVREPDQ